MTNIACHEIRFYKDTEAGIRILFPNSNEGGLSPSKDFITVVIFFDHADPSGRELQLSDR